MKILVTGGNGQLGTALTLQKSKHEIISCTRDELNIEKRQSISEAMALHKPDAVINCAAWTDVDGCEEEPDKAFNTNGYSVGVLKEFTEKFNSRLIQISTDYVFDGTKSSPYTENDLPNPLNIYGHSKLLGEQLAGERSLIIRTSWIFSRKGHNILQSILALLEKDNKLRFVNDQIGNPTYSYDLAAVILKLIDSSATGLFHVTNADPVSWYELAVKVAELTDKNPERIVPIATEELKPQRKAQRPKNSVLENKSLVLKGYSPVRSHEKALLDALQL
tara:strand:- start:432 stop:1262 length:831 start_codon:yes stop_codon:yes gene_type:complete